MYSYLFKPSPLIALLRGRAVLATGCHWCLEFCLFNASLVGGTIDLLVVVTLMKKGAKISPTSNEARVWSMSGRSLSTKNWGIFKRDAR